MIDDRANDALTVASRALAYAEAERASECEALVMAEDAALTRFANSQIHQNVAETNATVNLRFVVGNRVVYDQGFSDAVALREHPGRYVCAGIGDWNSLLQKDVQHHLALLEHRLDSGSRGQLYVRVNHVAHPGSRFAVH